MIVVVVNFSRKRVNNGNVDRVVEFRVVVVVVETIEQNRSRHSATRRSR